MIDTLSRHSTVSGLSEIRIVIRTETARSSTLFAFFLVECPFIDHLGEGINLGLKVLQVLHASKEFSCI